MCLNKLTFIKDVAFDFWDGRINRVYVYELFLAINVSSSLGCAKAVCVLALVVSALGYPQHFYNTEPPAGVTEHLPHTAPLLHD